MKNTLKNDFLAFTLIELVVSMTIFFVIVMATYVPYSYYQNKSKISQSTKEIIQSLYEARNMAINWTSSGSNLSIWLYFDSRKAHKGSIRFLSYPYTFTWSQIAREPWGQVNLLKTINLQTWIEINSIDAKSNWLFLFDAISWKGKYYYWDSFWNKKEILTPEIKINFSYKNSDSPNLKKEIIYYTKTNIADY